MKKSVFIISKMDCPSEERIIRMKLEDSSVKELVFDIPQRLLTVYHESEVQVILDKLETLKFGTMLKESMDSDIQTFENQNNASETKVLKVLLTINAMMFVLEIITGLMADSLGLVSDSIDMLADALVYSLSLFAVGKTVTHKMRAAKLSGYFQLLLALGICIEAVRRFFYGTEPQSGLMIGISIIALIANVVCLLLISKHREGGVHMKASWIFSANDVIANLGVIVAGILVAFTQSNYPDLVIGLIVAGFVMKGAFSILQLSK